MPFISHWEQVETKGTKTVTIEVMEHVRGLFSGPQTEDDFYYSITGQDTRKPNEYWLPPVCNTMHEAEAHAYRYFIRK